MCKSKVETRTTLSHYSLAHALFFPTDVVHNSPINKRKYKGVVRDHPNTLANLLCQVFGALLSENSSPDVDTDLTVYILAYRKVVKELKKSKSSFRKDYLSPCFSHWYDGLRHTVHPMKHFIPSYILPLVFLVSIKCHILFLITISKACVRSKIQTCFWMAHLQSSAVVPAS